MKRLACMLAVYIGVVCGAAQAHADTVSYAIVIGNNEPPANGSNTALAPLRYADDDAVRQYQLLSRFAHTRLLTQLDGTTQRRYPDMAAKTEPPTLDRLRAVVADHAVRIAADRARGDDAVLYFVFSGHGARTDSGEAFLAMTDGALTQAVLYDEVIAALPTAYSHLFIDACHAGGIVGARGDFFADEADAVTAPITNADLFPMNESARLKQFPHVGVILAATLGQEAHEWSEIESGVFTHELISGLAGAADVNGDRVIEYSELQAFIASANRSIRDPRATPRVFARAPLRNRNVPLVSLAQLTGTRLVEGDFSALDHFYVELENGQRYLDANVAADGATAIAIPADVAVFLRTRNREGRIPSGARVAVADVRMRPHAQAKRGSIDHAYRGALFSAQYGRRYYQGFVDSVGLAGVRFRPPSATRAHLQDVPSPRSRKRKAVTAAAVAGGATAISLTSAALAWRAKRDFDATDQQRAAAEAKERVERYQTIAIAAGATAVVAGVAAWWLWPDASEQRTTVVPTTSGRGDYGLVLLHRW